MPKTPTYRSRKDYPNKALVTLTDSATGKRRDYWLGQLNSRESRERYHLVIAAWEANERRFPDDQLRGHPIFGPATASPDTANAEVVTVKNVIKAYWFFAKKYYRPDEAGTLKVALRLLRDYYGSLPAGDFGPNKLRLLREEMIRGNPAADPPRKPWSRVYINSQCRRIRQTFKWAASHEMIPASVPHSLGTLEPLKRGRTEAKENEPVGPVSAGAIEAVKPFVSRQVAALIDLQLLTGARSGELVKLRAIDINAGDGSGVWTFEPKEHKNKFRGQDRTLYFGPAAQAVLRPFMANRPLDAFLFSPREAEAERRAKLHAARRTPLSCGNRPGLHKKDDPLRQIGPYYTPQAFRIAVARGCDQAFPPPPHLRPADGESEETFLARLSPPKRAELAAWRKAHRWHPHQLRHAAATNIRRQHGLEMAQLVLGHSSAAVTDAVYAERDHGKIVEVMKQVG